MKREQGIHWNNNILSKLTNQILVQLSRDFQITRAFHCMLFNITYNKLALQANIYKLTKHRKIIMRAKLIFKMEKVYKSIKSLAFIQLTNQPKLWVFLFYSTMCFFYTMTVSDLRWEWLFAINGCYNIHGSLHVIVYSTLVIVRKPRVPEALGQYSIVS